MDFCLFKWSWQQSSHETFGVWVTPNPCIVVNNLDTWSNAIYLFNCHLPNYLVTFVQSNNCYSHVWEVLQIYQNDWTCLWNTEFPLHAVDRIQRNGVHSLNHDEVPLYAQPSESAVSPHEGQTSQSHHLSHTDNAAPTSKVDLEEECDVSRGLVRPQIFCLEHAIQTEELLHSKGGANVLVICHSGNVPHVQPRFNCLNDDNTKETT